MKNDVSFFLYQYNVEYFYLNSYQLGYALDNFSGVSFKRMKCGLCIHINGLFVFAGGTRVPGTSEQFEDST